jgi:hypothetical protein
MLAGVIGLAMAIGMQQPVDPAFPADTSRELPVSLTRIRTALDRPAWLRLTLPESNADFHIEIRERPLYSPHLLGPVESLWSTTPGPVPPGGLHAFEQRQRLGEHWSQPMLSVDLLSIGAALRKSIADARRSSAEKAAREEVQRAIAEFCAAHECP